MELDRYIVLFSLFSCMGWMHEEIYFIIKDRKWYERGFLYGPVCPIYGVGGLCVLEVMKILPKGPYQVLQIYLISVFGSLVLELSVSYALERLFHASWWDYSDMPLNFQGRISLPTTLGFGVAGVVIAYIIAPYTVYVVSFLNPLQLQLLALLFFGLFCSDLTLTICALTDFAERVEQTELVLNGRMEAIVDEAYRRTLDRKEDITRGLSGKKEAVTAMYRAAVSRIVRFRLPHPRFHRAENSPVSGDQTEP